MINAHSFTAPTVSPLSLAPAASLRFGISPKSTAASLRQLADMIDSGAVTLDSVRVQSLASHEDWTTTVLRLKLYERAPLQPSTEAEVNAFIAAVQADPS